MRTIYFATTNRGKFLSAQRHLSPYGYHVVQVEMEIDEPEHTNDSRAIVVAKCWAALEKVPGPVVCEDGGFYVRALGWEPGVKVHGYLSAVNGEGMKGAEKLLYDLRESGDRYGYFLDILAYAKAPGVKPLYFEGKVEGMITRSIRGVERSRNWSPIHLIFIPKGYGKTMAEMSAEEYGIFSENVSVFSRLSKYLSQFTL